MSDVIRYAEAHRMLLARFCVLVASVVGTQACAEIPSENGSGSSTRELWVYRDTSGARGVPLIASDRDQLIASGGTLHVTSLDTRTGRLLWKAFVGDAGAPAGLPSATGVISGDLAIVPVWDLVGLDRATGREQWRYAPIEEYPAASSLALAGDVVISPGSHDHLYAVRAASGELLWKKYLGERALFPVIADGIAYVGARDGPRPQDRMEGGHIWAVEVATGNVRWKAYVPGEAVGRRPGGTLGPVAVTADRVIAGSSNGTVYGVNRADGRIAWTFAAATAVFAGVVVVDGVAITADLEGRVVGLNPTDGRVLWTVAIPGGSSVFQPLTAAQNCALISVGAVECITAQGRAAWSVGGWSELGFSFVSPAAGLDSTMYVGSSHGIHAYRVPLVAP